MRYLPLAAALALAAGAVQAQPAEVPRHNCAAAPKMPGKNLMGDKMVRRQFDNDLKVYKDCMTAYLDQRNATIKAHQDAANEAISEYNAAMRALIDAQEEMKGGKKDETAPKKY